MWKDHLEDLLNYHVLPIVVHSSDITNGSKEPTVNEEEIGFSLKVPVLGETGIFVNTDAEVVEADIDIVNGIVHVIDDVLLPPWVSKSIMDIATDENPTKLPGGEDLKMFVDDLQAQVLDAVDDYQLPDILSAPGGYTVFAPTNAAFLNDVSKLKDLSPDQLSSVLNYHVVEGVYPESDLVEGLTLTTLQGEKLTFKSNIDTDGKVTTIVDDETIITPNILANNGIVHVIDGVLIPDG
jgi:transforming growth factor-beta-induced protein